MRNPFGKDNRPTRDEQEYNVYCGLEKMTYTNYCFSKDQQFPGKLEQIFGIGKDLFLKKIKIKRINTSQNKCRKAWYWKCVSV